MNKIIGIFVLALLSFAGIISWAYTKRSKDYSHNACVEILKNSKSTITDKREALALIETNESKKALRDDLLKIVETGGWGDQELLRIAMPRLSSVGFKEDAQIIKKFGNNENRKLSLAASIAAMRLEKMPSYKDARREEGVLKFQTTHITHSMDISDLETVLKFNYRNPSDEKVTIVKAQSSCLGCSKVTVDEGRILGKGDSGSVRVVIKTKGLQGTIKKDVFLFTLEGNEEQSMRYPLTVTLEIPKYLEIAPSSLRWKEETPRTPKNVTINILHEEPIHITNVMSDKDAFIPELQCIEPGREYVVSVTPKSSVDKEAGYIRLLSDHPKAKYLPLKFWASTE